MVYSVCENGCLYSTERQKKVVLNHRKIDYTISSLLSLPKEREQGSQRNVWSKREKSLKIHFLTLC